MGDISLRALMDYEDETYDERAADGRLLKAFRTQGKGRSNATAKAVWFARVAGVREFLEGPDGERTPCSDRCTWVSQGKIANRVGVDVRSVRTAEAWLVKHGFLYECDTPRRKARGETTSWWVVDVLGENAALEAWKTETRAALLREATRAAASPPDEALFAGLNQRVEAQVDAARAAFSAANPGRFPTAGRVLAILEGREPHLPPTKEEAYTRMRSTTAAVVQALEERGVKDAETVLADELAARKARHEPITATAIRRGLDAGEFEHLVPATASPVLTAAAPGDR